MNNDAATRPSCGLLHFIFAPWQALAWLLRGYRETRFARRAGPPEEDAQGGSWFCFERSDLAGLLAMAAVLSSLGASAGWDVLSELSKELRLVGY